MRTSVGALILEAGAIALILALLSLVALPKYWDTRAERRKTVERSMAAAVRSEIFAYHVEIQARAKQLKDQGCAGLPNIPAAQCAELFKQPRLPCELIQNTTPTCWPAALDQAGIGAQSGLFSFVFRSAATRPDDGWTLVAPGTYRGPYGGTWTYNGMIGAFLCRGWCP